jgi:hypothetical protein
MRRRSDTRVGLSAAAAAPPAAGPAAAAGSWCGGGATGRRAAAAAAVAAATGVPPLAGLSTSTWARARRDGGTLHAQQPPIMGRRRRAAAAASARQQPASRLLHAAARQPAFSAPRPTQYLGVVCRPALGLARARQAAQVGQQLGRRGALQAGRGVRPAAALGVGDEQEHLRSSGRAGGGQVDEGCQVAAACTAWCEPMPCELQRPPRALASATWPASAALVIRFLFLLLKL